VSFSFVPSVTNDADATIKVLSGGIVNGGTSLFRNMMTVLNGGAVSNLTVGSSDELIVSFGGIARGSTVASSGTEWVASGGTDIDVIEERKPHHDSQPLAGSERVGKEARRAAPARYPYIGAAEKRHRLELGRPPASASAQYCSEACTLDSRKKVQGRSSFFFKVPSFDCIVA
jgi:autotransporter passenger strand-loop-strand repeat protein